ncbi:hypothetical protein HDV05_005309 [Chytridiales sp. JEL 0842]|nr:hypothetical protein HDV05_005309 [Chytridiales sp. JEL 0842]
MTSKFACHIISLSLAFIAFLSSCTPSVSALRATRDNRPVLPPAVSSLVNMSAFDWIEYNFQMPEKRVLNFLWRIENRGTKEELIHGLLILNATEASIKSGGAKVTKLGGDSVANAWAGIAFGSCMLASDFIIVHAKESGNSKDVSIYSMRASQLFSAPIENDDAPAIFAEPPPGASHVLYQGEGLLVAEFRRYTVPSFGDTVHMMLDITKDQSIIWAYNLNPIATPSQKWKISHGLENRGQYEINFIRDYGKWKDVTLDFKFNHGIGMAVVWMILFPAAVFWARYGRSFPKLNRGWMWVHMGAQVTGTVLVVIWSIYIILSLPARHNFGANDIFHLWNRAHPLLGFTILFFLLLQTALGPLNRVSMTSSRIAVYRKYLRTLHHLTGYLLILLGWIQVGLGTQIFFPFTDALPSHSGRGYPGWVLYIFWIVFWSVAFFGTELYFMIYVRHSDFGLKISKSGVALKKGVKNPTPSNREWFSFLLNFFQRKTGDPVDVLKVPSKIHMAPSMDASDFVSSSKSGGASSQYPPGFKTFTWDDINSALALGHLYVVAKGKYVYDINNWIDSHPGGQVVLYGVAGTDITNDYFHEAGFDASSFVKRPPKIERAHRDYVAKNSLQKGATTDTLNPESTQQTLPLHTGPAPSISTSSSLASNFPNLSELEWKQLVKARRTHVHSRLAIEKLSELMVGFIEGSEDQPSDDTFGGPLFTPFEYRRYALVDSQLSSGAGTNTPVYRQKFCILYPHDTRSNEPTHFLPGQCVEIQCRVKGRFISRYYTPVAGTPACFEIEIKLRPKGALTPHLMRQKPGDRQIKIRGPFGTPSFSPERPLAIDGRWCFDKLVFIAAGSGLTPALQALQYLFLPLQVPLYVMQPYLPQQADELQLSQGDWVFVREHLMDGWAYGTNMSTREEGLFPLPVTAPRCGPQVSFNVVVGLSAVADSFGLDLIKGALLAYPANVNFTYCLSQGAVNSEAALEEMRNRCPGAVVDGKISVEVLVDIIMRRVGWQQQGFGAGYMSDSAGMLRKVVVCGPQSFEGKIYEMLTDGVGVDHHDIVMLPEDQFI